MHRLPVTISLLLLFLIVAENRCLADDDSAMRPDVGMNVQLRQVMTFYDAKLSEMVRKQEESDRRTSLLESKLSKCGEDEEKRQVSFTSLNRLMENIRKHPGQVLAVPDTPKDGMNMAAAAAAAVAAKIGSVYTRWGRTACDSNSSLIYSGFTSGTDYLTKGGGGNYQCMPLDPEYSEYNPDGLWSELSGVQYSTDETIFKSVSNYNVPCARCYTSNSATMMIPGKRTCPVSWREEYQGYLMTESMYNYRTTFECIDSEPETVGASGGLSGGLMNFVKIDCSGSGAAERCPPYNHDKPVTCIVCSK